MYIYFNLLNAVLTCEEYPQLVYVENIIKSNCVCDKWEKTDYPDGTFTLSYKYTKCQCSNNNYKFYDLPDFHEYDCYSCGITKKEASYEGTSMYLSNSGSQDIVWAHPKMRCNKLKEVQGYKNVYEWYPKQYNNTTFALHIEDGRLSDANISNNIDNILKKCSILFVDNI